MFNSAQRLKGLEYEQINKKSTTEKSVRGNPCSHGKCQNQCGTISDEDRQTIFKIYYDMRSHQQQKDFLVTYVSAQDKKRQYTKAEISRRKVTKNYYLPINGVRRKVCLKFLLKTLDISEKLVRYSYENKTDLNTAKSDCRGQQPPQNKTAPELSSNVEGFISSLPAVPSHYCRAGSTRKYLPSDFKNLSHIFRMYKALCEKNKNPSVSEKVFKNIFHNKFNIGIHVPKKDKCVQCEKFKNTSETDRSEEQSLKFKKHKVEVQFSKSIHLTAQEYAKSCESFICASFDLQKVLNTPHGNSMLLYSSQWCRYPRGKCTCSQGVGYARLHETVEDTWREIQTYDELPSTSREQSEELAFFNDNESFQLVVVERNLCASDLCQLLALKNRTAKSVHWSIIEQWNDLGLERMLEDHEYVLAAYKDMKMFSCHARFKFRFRKEFRKYEFFHHPQQFFPYGMLNIENEASRDENKNPANPSHLQVEYLVIQDGMCPVIFSHVWIRDDKKKIWIKTYMLLRDQRLFISQKIQSLAKFMRTPKEQALELLVLLLVLPLKGDRITQKVIRK
ncbi:unnamed protein product [Diabrotica balteata]|uniref:Ras-associating domain-containing protein n=1 Tax=Diabrotica balteata TaxID=107213 RepID=A0A9N9X639_DIABA|nr:unnamed protein product [Diabrotica balteata]